MTPDLSYTTTGREGESSARIMNRMENKTDTKIRTAFETSYTNKQLQQYRGGIPIQDYPLTTRSRRSLLSSAVGNAWLLVCRTWRFGSYYVPNGYIFYALGTNCIYSS